MPELKVYTFGGKVTSFSKDEIFETHTTGVADNPNPANSPTGGKPYVHSSSHSIPKYVNTRYGFTIRLDETSKIDLKQDEASITMTSSTRSESLDGETLTVRAYQHRNGGFAALDVFCKERDFTIEADFMPVNASMPKPPDVSYFVFGALILACITCIVLIPTLSLGDISILFLIISIVLLIVFSTFFVSAHKTYIGELDAWKEYDRESEEPLPN